MKRRVIIAIVLLTTLAGACGFYAWKALSTKGISQLPHDSWALPSTEVPVLGDVPSVDHRELIKTRYAIFTTVTATISDELRKSHEINPNEPEWFGTVTYDEQTKKTTYYHPKSEFEIKIPSVYSIRVSSSKFKKDPTLLSSIEIYDPNDTSPHVVPVRIFGRSQPIVYGGDTYSTIEEYVKKYPDFENSRGFVIVNGIKMAYYSYGESGAENAPIDAYMFIKDELIYEVFVDVSNQDIKGIIGSIRFR